MRRLFSSLLPDTHAVVAQTWSLGAVTGCGEATMLDGGASEEVCPRTAAYGSCCCPAASADTLPCSTSLGSRPTAAASGVPLPSMNTKWGMPCTPYSCTSGAHLLLSTLSITKLTLSLYCCSTSYSDATSSRHTSHQDA
eukprot:GHRQ01035384.1.p1 GENE.GHRQ01035384.1~~GHRQ01035384.1.p1  ORF type:complete len:139 (-),score=21.34 GHRQ01035384.1:894-1310(-)